MQILNGRNEFTKRDSTVPCPAMSPPTTTAKRQKVGGAEDVAVQMWEHYRNYVDSLDEPQGGDIDELQEMIEISKPHVTVKSMEVVKDTWETVVDLLPMLVSVGYYHLAESAIAEYLQPGNNTTAQAEQCQSLLMKSLEFFPKNAATWSMGANFGRMAQRLSLSTARQWYERSSEYASELRERALLALEDEGLEDAMLKEWIELLVLNQVVGVEFEVDEEVEATTNQDEIEEKDTDDDVDHEETDGHFSASAVEGTSRFMCAMLASMEGKHDDVIMHLQRFEFTHRLHPNVWKSTPSAPTAEGPIKPPLVFAPSDGILPQHLYESMKLAFAPNAAYWVESNYMGRGYYSYFMDYDSERKEPRNLIEDVIVNYLLPRAKQVLSKEEGEQICGFEWWTHTRPIQANLGHNLHFDTDEALLAQEKKVTHPILSSVLYLTGGNSDDQEAKSPAGATIILDQTPEAAQVAECCWKGSPKDNSFLLFPGNLLHGVLPCPGRESAGDGKVEKRSLTPCELWKNWKSPGKQFVENRLTFMVGFWTRNVPETMKERHLYGPCGPLPPATKEHSWVQFISQGYNEGQSRVTSSKAPETLPPSPIPQISPAWEVIPPMDKDDEPGEVLMVPPSINHRFFVTGAPKCFYDCLFEEDIPCG